VYKKNIIKFEMAEDNGWDMTDFLQRYTVKSTTQSSPVRSNDLFSLSNNNVFEKSPEKLHEELNQDGLFCTNENLEQRLQYLNQELTMLGYESILSNKCASNNNNNSNNIMAGLDMTKLVNNTYELIRRQHSNAKNNEDLEARQTRSENDNEYLLQNQARLKQDLENLKREAALLLCREKDQIKRCAVLQQDIKSEREEKRKMKSDVDHLKKQFYHESKRKEKEATRLKDKVHQTLNDKQGGKIGLELLNSLQRVDGKRSTWKTGGKKNEDEMYKMIISNFEEKEKAISHENSCMREVLTDVQGELLSMDTSAEDIEEDTRRLQMPFHIVKQDVESRLQSLLISLKQKMEGKSSPQKHSSPITDDDSFSIKQINEDLVTKLQQCKAVINGQEKILKKLKEDYSKEAFEKMLLDIHEEEVKVQTSSSIIEEQKKMQEERKQFADYVLQIAKEREDFERERVDFYMHCISTPVINNDKKKKYQKDLRRDSVLNNRIVTPSFSPAQQKSKVKTPSTAELYKFMSLNYDSGISRASERLSSLDGSYTQPHSANESLTSPSSQKLQEHANNVRRAVEERHNKTLEESESK